MQYNDWEQYNKVIEINSELSISVTGKLGYIFWYNIIECEFQFSATLNHYADTSITLISESIKKKYNEAMNPMSFDELSPQMIQDFENRFLQIITDVEPIAKTFRDFYLKKEQTLKEIKND